MFYRLSYPFYVALKAKSIDFFEKFRHSVLQDFKVNELKIFYDNNFLWDFFLFSTNGRLSTCCWLSGRLVNTESLFNTCGVLLDFSDIIIISQESFFLLFCYFRLIFYSPACNAALAL